MGQLTIGGQVNFSEQGERNYEVLKRCRLIPSFLSFDSSVCRGMPSLVAAPVGPETSPSASRSAVSIISFSWSIRFATRGTLDAAVFGVTGVSQVSSKEKVSPSLRITAPSITSSTRRPCPASRKSGTDPEFSYLCFETFCRLLGRNDRSGI